MKVADRIITILAAAAILGAILAGQLDLVPRGAICWSVRLLGRECAGCGLTRSFAAIGTGDLAKANALNPLGPILFAWAVILLAVRAGRRAAPRFRYWSEIDGGAAAGVALAVALRLILFYLG